MQAIHLVELATIVVFYADQFVAGHTSMNSHAFDRFWKHSKTRIFRWKVVLNATRPGPIQGDRGAFFYAVAEEIFAAEVLNRVWTSVGYSMRDIEVSDRAQAALQSVALGHAEVRNQLLQFISTEKFPPKLVHRLERCRQLSESWADLLLAFLPQDAASRQAFDFNRFGDYRRSIESPAYRDDTLRRIVTTLRSTKDLFNEVCPHENLNRLVGNSITASLGPDLLDSVGPFQDLWQTRLTQTTQDTLDSVQVLMAEEGGYPLH
ncbi:MAG: hypothetical protein AAGF97_00725 [Planctomycetota bacterium]